MLQKKKIKKTPSSSLIVILQIISNVPSSILCYSISWYEKTTSRVSSSLPQTSIRTRGYSHLRPSSHNCPQSVNSVSFTLFHLDKLIFSVQQNDEPNMSECSRFHHLYIRPVCFCWRCWSVWNLEVWIFLWQYKFLSVFQQSAHDTPLHKPPKPAVHL